MTSDHLIPCVNCDHDTALHWAGARSRKEWERWNQVNWKDDPCKLDGCECKAFKHPEAPRRREAIEHTRRMG